MKNACNATTTVHLIREPPFYSSWIKATPGVYSHDEGDCYATFKAANARTAYSISAQQLAYLVLPITEIEGQEIATQRFNRDVSFARQQVSQAERESRIARFSHPLSAYMIFSFRLLFSNLPRRFCSFDMYQLRAPLLKGHETTESTDRLCCLLYELLMLWVGVMVILSC